jgi:EAL domain-containing protein (putative c-di-GMP-specific phosphodiesterase class I)
MLRQADQAMYQAKLAGKNRYHIFDAEQDRSVRGHHEDLAHIRQAFQAREFELHYQPKVNMRSGEVIGVEALIRWRHPTRGLLGPGVFLPAIEDQPIAVEIGEWVIDTALAQLRQWQSGGLHIPVSVNIGARQLQQTDFVGRLRAVLQRYPDVAPTDLELEVLETSALEDLSHVSQVINECHQLGVHFALDDFGTGYSSLTYLKLLPVAQLKIDQSFVRDMLVDPDDLAILEGIIGLANAFHRQVIAEGVESVQTGQMLLQMGCERAQGFGIARPMPAADIPPWVANWRTDHSWLNQTAIGREDFPLLFATVEHRAWVIALEQFLAGERDFAPPVHVEQCRMGMWLKGGGLDAYASLPAAQAAHQLHHAVHAAAAQILAWHALGDAESVAQGLKQLHGLRDSLLAQLHILLNR